ncbi:hypothetical protein ACP70R_043826 [Stipagrostis hirtigluma subsp. patula]
MSVRALRSLLLTRTLSSRGIPGTRALGAAAARRPARSFHVLMDGVFGAATVAASVGLFGFLYLSEDRAEEEAYKARFEAWMQRNGRRYIIEEEKDMRYEIFKETAKRCDEHNASSKKSYFAAPTWLADWTEEELKLRCGTRRDYGPYVEEDIVQGKVDGCQGVTGSEVLTRGMTEHAAVEARRQAARMKR